MSIEIRIIYLKKQIKQFKPDVIFHFAAEAIVKNSFQNPKKT